jgi:hypothetical protein
MSYVSGDPLAGIIYTYSTTLTTPATDYAYRFIVYDIRNGTATAGTPVSWSTGPVVLSNLQQGILSGKVVDTDGVPVPNVHLEINVGQGFLTGQVSLATPDGTFQLYLDPGEYIVTVSAPGYVIAVVPQVLVSPQTTTEVTFTLKRIVADVPSVEVISAVVNSRENRSLIIRYNITQDNTRVRMAIYTFTGKEITVLADDTSPRGSYIVKWFGSTEPGMEFLGSGMYLIRTRIGDQPVQVHKMVLIR